MFDVTNATPYSMIGSWRTDHSFSGAPPPACLLRFERLSPNPEVFHDSFSFDDTFSGDSFRIDASVNLRGLLPAGRYRIQSQITSFRGGMQFGIGQDAEFSFDLQVPAPTTSLLLGFGSAFILRRRR